MARSTVARSAPSGVFLALRPALGDVEMEAFSGVRF
jgi:hypothetical protein